MHALRSARWIFLALLLSVIPATLHAQFIRVEIAPPPLPVYEQPPCPEEGLIWTPGYWAYGDEGYFWVPGAWVPAPYEGALWTPPYWGWAGGRYMFHPGYWGRHVGYYGGINYGFGYFGIGFLGGMWREHHFAYNTSIMNVDRRYVHSFYEDRGARERGWVERDSHVAFSGGPGGIRHDPGAEERLAEREQHMGITSYQSQHENAARGDRSFYFNNNHGRPEHGAVARPMGNPNQPAQSGRGNMGSPNPINRPQPGVRPNNPDARFTPQGQNRPGPQSPTRPTPQSSPRPNVQTPVQPPRDRQSVKPPVQPAPQATPRPSMQSPARPAPQPQPRPTIQTPQRPTGAQHNGPAPAPPKGEHEHK